MPPCLVISMISSTGILQLTSYVDTQKSNPSLSKIIEPIKIDIVAEPKIMASSKDSQTMTATASVTTVSKTTIPTFGSGQPPVPVKAPTAFAGFGTGAASMTSASASVAAATMPTFGSGQPPAPVNAKAVTSKSNATPLRNNLGRSVDKDIDAIAMDITDDSFDGTASGSNSIYTLPSTPLDKCHYLLLRIQSEVNDFREMYSKNITHDLKTGSVIALAMEANLSSLKLKCRISQEIIMRDLPLLLGKVKRIVGTGDVDASHLEDTSNLEAALDALSLDLQPNNLLKRLLSVQQLIVQTRSLIRSCPDNCFTSQNLIFQRRFEGRPISIADNHSSHDLDLSMRILSESILAFNKVVNEQLKSIDHITNNSDSRYRQSVDILQYPLPSNPSLTYDHPRDEKNCAAMLHRRDFRIDRRKKWNGLVGEMQHQHRKATSTSILYTDYTALERDGGDKSITGGLSQSAKKNQNLYRIGRETSAESTLTITDGTTQKLATDASLSIQQEQHESKMSIKVSPPQLPPPIPSNETLMYHPINHPAIPSKAPSAFGGFGQIGRAHV